MNCCEHCPPCIFEKEMERLWKESQMDAPDEWQDAAYGHNFHTEWRLCGLFSMGDANVIRGTKEIEVYTCVHGGELNLV